MSGAAQEVMQEVTQEATQAMTQAAAQDSAVATAEAAAAVVEPPASSIASPCNNVCKMDREAGWCIGCRRTRDEIAAWRKLDDAGRLAILARLEARWFDAAPEPAGGA